MKRITFNGGSIVTSNAIAAALLEYTTTLTDAENSVTVDVTVLEDDGETTVHTLVLSATSQFDVADVAGMSEEEEARRFPVPEMPPVGMTAVVGASDAARIADDVNAVMDEIDEGLGH